jgi:hypothetical protein
MVSSRNSSSSITNNNNNSSSILASLCSSSSSRSNSNNSSDKAWAHPRCRPPTRTKRSTTTNQPCQCPASKMTSGQAPTATTPRTAALVMASAKPTTHHKSTILISVSITYTMLTLISRQNCCADPLLRPLCSYHWPRLFKRRLQRAAAAPIAPARCSLVIWLPIWK